MEVVQSLEKGGRTVRFSDTVSGLRQKAIAVVPVCFARPAEWVHIDGLLVVPRRRGINWSLVFKLRSLLREQRVDIVHAHCEFSQLYAGLAAKLCGIPCIGTFHRSDLNRYRPSLVNLLIRHILAHFVSVSHDRVGLLRNQLKVPERCSTVVHGGTWVPAPVSVSQRTQLRRQLGIAQSQIALLSLGHLGVIKGHQDTLEAMARLVPEYPNLHLYIGGDGSPQERASLESRCRSLGLHASVTFLGQIDNAALWLKAADIFVQPSLEEAFGLVFIEAGAAAKPVVATRVGGIVEIVVDGDTGFLVPVANPDALADALKKLVDDPQLREQMGDAGYRRIKAEFSIDSMVSRYLNLFQQCLTHR